MNELLKLKDIKPNVPVQIHTNNSYIWIFIIFFSIFVIFLIAVIIKKYLKTKKEKQELLKLINNPKKFAYEFTKRAKKFKNKKNEKLFDEINLKLSEYKYKPKVKNIDEKTISLIKQYLEIK